MATQAIYRDISSLVQSMSELELNVLKNHIEKEEAQRKANIEATYGSHFCKIVGIEQIYLLAQVEAKELSLESHSKYPEKVVTPKMLGQHSAVRGITGQQHPFIAIRIDVLDCDTKEKVDEVVELIYTRHSLKGDGGKGRIHENNYVTALTNTSANGKTLNSFLYSSGGMSNEQMEAVSDLLSGKQIIPPENKWSLIRQTIDHANAIL